MHPFFYPTTTLIIDDEPLLLESIESTLSNTTLCKSFHNTKSALEYAQTSNKHYLDIEDFLSTHSNDYEFSQIIQGDIFVRLKASYWFHMIQSDTRFSELSVAIVDYYMPFMNGIDLCRKLKHLPMKKIMLTGLASKELAVEAFNEKIIDSFILKQDVNLVEKLSEEIKELQKEYFIDKTKTIKFALSHKETQFINEPAFHKRFHQILKENDIIELLSEFISTGRPLIAI